MSYRRSPHPTCEAKRLLLCDVRPIPNSPTQSLLRKTDLCPTRCIYCDIWKLALIVSSRQNRGSNQSTPTSASPQSPRQTYSFQPWSEYDQALKTIESGHHLQRARVSSIISICTVKGAEESEGLRIAHDRCLSAVFDLMRQERALQRQMVLQREMLEKEARERDEAIREWRERELERDYGHGYSRRGNSHSVESRRASEVSCAM